VSIPAACNTDGGPGKPVRGGGVGYSCIAQVRITETIASGALVTPFMKYDDKERIWIENEKHHPIFGVIEQVVRGG